MDRGVSVSPGNKNNFDGMDIGMLGSRKSHEARRGRREKLLEVDGGVSKWTGDRMMDEVVGERKTVDNKQQRDRYNIDAES
jgi:hypothetical protein